MLNRVQTKYGIVEGVKSNAGFALFRGVPYAKPPVGELRWRAPEDPEPWDGVRVCDTYGPACVQFDRWDNATDDVTDDSGHPYIKIANYPYPPKMSEDCLYLNIYTPAESAEDKLPVLFYIHGGGCQQWYGSDYEYCGDGFCKHGCVVVNITYRLNVFGYFTHPELAAESGHNASGNYGLMDQIQALKWVHENIAGFGGDPDRIMCFGQSAGGGSTMAILCSPLNKGYVRRASMQSSGGLSRRPGMSREAMEEKGRKFMEDCGCKNIAEMRALPWTELQAANDRMGGMFNGFNMYTDGYVLPTDQSECMLNGTLPDVDIIMGCTADEGGNKKPPMFGGNMLAGIRAFAQVQLNNGKKPIHMYVFDREQPGDDNVGVPHSCDNRYQFGTLDGSWRPYDASDWALSEQMQKYWANFARTGDPNGEGLTEWLPYTGDKLALRLAVEGCEMRDYDKELDGKLSQLESEILESKK